MFVSFLGVFSVKNRMSAWEEQNELEVLSGSFWISEDGDKLFECAVLLKKNVGAWGSEPQTPTVSM